MATEMETILGHVELLERSIGRFSLDCETTRPWRDEALLLAAAAAAGEHGLTEQVAAQLLTEFAKANTALVLIRLMLLGELRPSEVEDGELVYRPTGKVEA